MTYAKVIDASQNAAPAASSWPRWVQTAAGALIRWQGRVRQRRDLRSLDDHMLSDIGLTRSDIDLESGKPFWRA